jgi:hypothetical protein
MTPTGSDDGMEEDLAVASKNEKIAQCLSGGCLGRAIGFMGDEGPKKEIDAGDNESLDISSACQIVNYILPFPFACQRNQIQVHHQGRTTDCRQSGITMPHIYRFFDTVGE